MGLPNSLLGDQKQQQGFEDFIRRYEAGHPAEGYSDKEVMDLYQQVAPNVPVDVYARAAEQSFNRLSAEERLNFVRQIREQSGSESMGYSDESDATNEQQYQDPAHLARMVSSIHQQQPDLLCQMVGGCQDIPSLGDGLLNSAEAKAVLAGIVAVSLREGLRSSRGEAAA